MSYNRIGAMGVEQGLVSPEEQFMAQRMDAARRAQMALLSGGGGVGGGGAVASDQQPGVVPSSGAPAGADIIDLMNRQGNQQLNMQRLRNEGDQGVATTHMAPDLMRAQLSTQAYGDQSGVQNMRNQIIMGHLKQRLAGGGQPDPNADPNMAMMQEAIDMGQSPAPWLAAQSQDKQHQWEIDARKQGSLDTLMAALAKYNPEAAAKLIPGSSLEGSDPQAIASAFTTGGQKQYEQLAPVMAPELQRMSNFIKSNNWSIAGNKPELKNLYDSILAKASTMRPSPEAFRAFQEDLKNAMRDALNTNIIPTYGAGDVRQAYGL